MGEEVPWFPADLQSESLQPHKECRGNLMAHLNSITSFAMMGNIDHFETWETKVE